MDNITRGGVYEICIGCPERKKVGCIRKDGTQLLCRGQDSRRFPDGKDLEHSGGREKTGSSQQKSDEPETLLDVLLVRW